jgi:hypothetical protein
MIVILGAGLHHHRDHDPHTANALLTGTAGQWTPRPARLGPLAGPPVRGSCVLQGCVVLLTG